MVFQNRIFLNDGANSSSSASTGANTSSTPAAPTTLNGAFDMAVNAVKDQPEISSPFDDDEEEYVDPLENKEQVMGEKGAVSSDVTTESEPPAFSPYSFKGKVLDQEVAKEFKTQKELDACIQRGLAAPRLYQDLKSLQEQTASLKEDSEVLNNWFTMAEKTPKDFLEFVFNEMELPEEVMMEFVADKFEVFKKTLSMSPGEREMQAKIKAAERIMAERQAFEKAQKEASEKAQKEAQEADRKVVTNWKANAENTWKQSLPSSYHKTVEEAISMTLAWGKEYVNAYPNQPLPHVLKECDKKLKSLLTHLKNVQTPEQAKKAAANAIADKSKEATSSLQGIAGSKQQKSDTPNKKLTNDDLWNNLIEGARSGKFNLKP